MRRQQPNLRAAPSANLESNRTHARISLRHAPQDQTSTSAALSQVRTNSNLEHDHVRQFLGQSTPKNAEIYGYDTQTFPKGNKNNARKLQRIDILLNLVYSRVANDRSLNALLPHIPQDDAQNVLSNFAYLRHQQDTQEMNSKMTEKQTYRILRHHYRAEQRLADIVRELRHVTANAFSQYLPGAPDSQPIDKGPEFAHAVADIDNDTAQMRAHHLELVEIELREMAHMCRGDDDPLYVQEFSQAQQISTMQARCKAMKDEYEADDMRKGRFSWLVSEVKNLPETTISGPEDWEDNVSQHGGTTATCARFGVPSGEWTPPDPLRSPFPKERHSRNIFVMDENEESEKTVHSAAYTEQSLSMPSPTEYPKRRSGRQAGLYQPEKRQERRDRNSSGHSQKRETKTQFSSRTKSNIPRGSSTQKSFSTTDSRRKSLPHHARIRYREERDSRFHSTLPDNKLGRGRRFQSQTTRIASKHPQRASRRHINPRHSSQATGHGISGESRYQYSNAEYATMPNLHCTSLGYRHETSQDDGCMPLHSGSGPSAYEGGPLFDPYRRSFPHESSEAHSWTTPEWATRSQYPSGFMSCGLPGPVLPQSGNPRIQSDLLVPDFPQGVGQTSYAAGDQRPETIGTRKRDEWRYTNALSSGLLDNKESVMHSIANKVKGRKENSTVPNNPIAAMQLARKDPVKFMTTMAGGDIMPQAKRKAHKVEAMLANESKVGGVSGHVGHMLTKMAKESMKETGGSSKAGLSGQVGQMIAKMTLDSAIHSGGSSKAGVTSHVGNVIAKMAKESITQPGSATKNAGMLKQVMNSLANA